MKDSGSASSAEAWRDNWVAGAGELTREAAALLKAELEGQPDVSLSDLAEVARSFATAHPAFGSLWRLMDRVLQVAEAAAERGAPVGPPACEALDVFALDLESAEQKAAVRASELIHDGEAVLVYSRSGTVARALAETRRRGVRHKVLISECRPECEGTLFARELAAAGTSCVLTTDAGLGLFLGRASSVLIGADAVTPRGFVHKSGTYALLLAAREIAVPVYVAAVRAKFLDPPDGTLGLPLGPTQGIAPSLPNMDVIHAPFEEIPFSLIQGICTESLFLSPAECADAARQAPIHPALANTGG